MAYTNLVKIKTCILKKKKHCKQRKLKQYAKQYDTTKNAENVTE